MTRMTIGLAFLDNGGSVGWVVDAPNRSFQPSWLASLVTVVITIVSVRLVLSTNLNISNKTKKKLTKQIVKNLIKKTRKMESNFF